MGGSGVGGRGLCLLTFLPQHGRGSKSPQSRFTRHIVAQAQPPRAVSGCGLLGNLLRLGIKEADGPGS